jgi:hypothetical protein
MPASIALAVKLAGLHHHGTFWRCLDCERMTPHYRIAWSPCWDRSCASKLNGKWTVIPYAYLVVDGS